MEEAEEVDDDEEPFPAPLRLSARARWCASLPPYCRERRFPTVVHILARAAAAEEERSIEGGTGEEEEAEAEAEGLFSPSTSPRARQQAWKA